MNQKFKSLIQDYKLLLREVPTMVTLAHVLSIVVMNLAALKVVFDIGSAAFTGGFFLSWVPFLCMDTVTKRFGGRAAVMINNLAALVDLVVVIFFSIVAAIPTENDYTAFNSIFASTWFVLLSSMLALIVSGYVNSAVNMAVAKLFKKDSKAEFFARSYVSTFIGQATDNFIFFGLLYCVFAPIYWGFSYSWGTAIGTAIVGGFVELLSEVIFSPVGYKVSKRWKEENIGAAYIDKYVKEAA